MVLVYNSFVDFHTLGGMMLYTEKMLFRQIRATLQSEGYDPRKVTEETRIKHDLDLH